MLRKNPIKRILRKKENLLINDKPKTIYHYDYEHDDGKEITEEEIRFAKSLVIPHKVDNESLRIFSPEKKILAKYKDSKGRQIYKYSKKELAKNIEEKYERNRQFENDIDNVIDNIKKKINISTKNGQAALILYIIYESGLRIGSENDTKADRKAYGISTLLNKHVSFTKDGKVKLDFIGKKGVRNSSIIDNPIIFKNLKLLKSPNYSYKIFDVSASHVRKFLKSIDDRFEVKDFRTLKANRIAKKEIEKRKGPAPTEKVFKKWQNEVADIVAKKLGNTRSVALNDYIDPSLWERWRKKEWDRFIPKYIK